MAITHVATFGSNGDKTTGTTLAVTATASPQPAVGDLIVVACARDDIANDPLTGDSVSDGHGNTYTRQVFAGGSAATDSTAGNAINLVVFYCVLTVAWSGTTTVTWTHPSLTARGMQVEHFAPDSGYTVALYDTPVSSNAFAASTTVVTTTSPTPAGDLVFGVAAVANDTTSTITGDSDTVGGSWSTVTTPAGTTGGTGNTNAFVVTQYKILTSPTTQAWGITHGATSSNSAAALLTFHQYPAAGPYLVGIGTQAASATGNVTPKLPPGTTTNDLLVLVVGGRPSSSSADGVTIASGTDGWAQHGSTSYVAVAAVDDLSVQVWWKLHDGSESDPTVSVNTVLAQAAAIDRGYSAQIAAFRNINTSAPFDVTAVTSNTGAAAATFTPTGVTTATNNALALSVVATADDNSLNFNTSQSFVLAFGGDEYDSAIGADHAVGLAWKVISAAGAVTMPTWNQSVNGNDQWVGLSTALRPPTASSDLASAAGSAFNASTTTSVPAAAGTAAATGTAYDATVTTGTSATDANAGTATASGTANNATTTSAAAPTAGSATGTGTAYTPTLTILSTAAAGTASAAGSAFDAAATTSVLAAAGAGTVTGVANTPGASTSQPAGAASVTGTANTPTITAAGLAASGTAGGTGPAYNAAPSSISTAAAGTAVATSAANNPTVTTDAVAAAGSAAATGTANTPTVTIDIHGALSTGTGTTYPPTITAASGANAGIGTGVGAAYPPALTIAAYAGFASASGTATAAALTVAATSASASAVGVANDPSTFTVNSADPGAFTFLVLRPSRTWAVTE